MTQLDVSQPIVVLGNGPVGQSAALLLARWGLAVRLIDKRSHRELVGSKAICQQRDVLDIWESVGAGRAIAREGVTWTTSRTYYREAELFVTRFVDSGESRFPPWVNLSQSRTEQILDERIAASPSIEVLWGHEVTEIRQDDERVRVVCTTPDGDREIEAPYLLACAGASAGALRDALGVSFEGHSFDDRFLICDIRADLPGRESERRFYFDPVWNPGRQVLIHACPDSTYRIDWQVAPGFDLGLEERTGGLDQRIRKIVGEADYEIVWRSVYRFQSRVASQLRVGRVLLVGDFAHLFAPFGARGLNSGVQDAENAAWKVNFVLRGWAPASILDSYHLERYAAARENLLVTTNTMRFLVPQTPDESNHRQQVLERALVDETARRQVDSGRLAEPFWYVDSPLTTIDQARPVARRPAPGEPQRPGPGVLMPDLSITSHGRRRPLRSALREGLVTICARGVELERVAAAMRRFGGVPWRALAADAVDPSGRLDGILDWSPGEIWLIRPDAHVAAVVRDSDELSAAASRVLGRD